MRILNFGSTNIDIVFAVDHIVAPGETISSTNMTRSTGGKGANQSVAVAMAGEHEVFHAGKIGPDGLWIKEKLQAKGVRTDFLTVGKTPTGQALIQVAANGQNSIVLYAGSNKEFTKSEIEAVFKHFNAGDWVMLQNEINLLDYIIETAHKKGLSICFNPAPFEASVLTLPLAYIDLLVVNEVEAEGLSGKKDPVEALDALTNEFPDTDIILTLGPLGARYGRKDVRYSYGTWKVPVIDTTAAGDTFIGCYVANIAKGKHVQEALELASAASSITVMRPGAMDSIPSPAEFSILDAYTMN
ncbi:MAG: ribokinase [Sphaerochaetaceae bacterium]|jgi:ribokinase|nr:ribokinase [Sphaerochaetaceae bacterium]MDD4220402.1 ribokinase [Sphaerochaetaceae bacterium]MDY0372405.1 ribokinase [Sphaerochaetaceae bacterium]